MVIGNCANVSDWVLSICFWNPVERERTIAILIIPILEAKAVKKVRPFLVRILLKDKRSAVVNFILVRFNSKGSFFSCSIWGRESWRIWPSENSIIRSAYSWANSGLWVTIITNFSFESSWISAIICRLVSESNAPVGSSQSKISGSLAKARAMATRCIWPPDNWEGFLWIWSFKPTRMSASSAFWRLSAFEIPLSVIPSSTLSKIPWWLIKL